MLTPKTYFIIERVENEADINTRLAAARERNECPVQVRVSNGFVVVLMQSLSDVAPCDCPACSAQSQADKDIASMFGFTDFGTAEDEEAN